MTKPTKQTSPIRLNYAGQPYNSDVDSYGGKPEFWPASEHLKLARQKLKAQPVTEEQRESMRERMRHAREVYRMRRLKAKDKAKPQVVTTQTLGNNIIQES